MDERFRLERLRNGVLGYRGLGFKEKLAFLTKSFLLSIQIPLDFAIAKSASSLFPNETNPNLHPDLLLTLLGMRDLLTEPKFEKKLLNHIGPTS